MRDLIIQVMPALLWAISAADLAVCVLLLREFFRQGRKPLPLLMALVAFGLFYDAFIVALGTVMGPGDALKGLSQLRYVLHCTLIPFTLPICGLALRLKKLPMEIIWAVTAALVVAGCAAGFSVVTESAAVGAVTRYASADATPAWADGVQNGLSFGPVFLIMAAGIALWVREKNPHLFLSGFLMFLFAALGPATGNFDLIFFISMFGELFMAVFFLLFVKKRKE